MSEELAKRGIRLEVFFDGKELNPENDGYLGKIGLGKFELRCLIKKKRGVKAIVL